LYEPRAIAENLERPVFLNRRGGMARDRHQTALAVTLWWCYFCFMGTITAKQLHQETKSVLNQLEEGESLLITRNGRPIGRIEPLTAEAAPGWHDIMAEVWSAQKEIKASDCAPNPVLQERNRRRR
jgi:antitoxin (DNA-binding transcriptional repressor) of toxin-antitoxin stability system